MKIIAGQLKGQTFRSPSGHRAHPMSERNRNALFNSLGDVSGLTVLDAYGGSGAIGFEAVSRGARRVDICEKSGQVARTISDNISKLGIGETAHLHVANVTQYLASTTSDYDIAIADPPFDSISIKQLMDIFNALMPGAIFALSHPADYSIEDSEFMGHYITHNVYGAAQLSYFRK